MMSEMQQRGEVQIRIDTIDTTANKCDSMSGCLPPNNLPTLPNEAPA
jgi:hypothetical protein